MKALDESTQTLNPDQQEPEEITPSEMQIANMDYSDYVSLLMESRII